MYNNLTESKEKQIKEFMQWLREHPEKVPEVKEAILKSKQ